MKKIFYLLSLLAVTVAITACGGPDDSALRAQIESGQRHCPMNLGMAGKLTKMDYDQKTREVEFVISLNKLVTDVKELKADSVMCRNTMRLALQKGDMKKLVEMMNDAQAGLKITYKNQGSQDEFNLNFTPAELKEIQDNPMSEEETNKLLLENQIRLDKNKLPMRIDRGLNVTAIDDTPASLIYVCEVDEDLYELAELGEAKEELKDNMRKMLKDKGMRQQAEILASLGKGFEYRYVGKTSGETVTVAFSSGELAEIAGKK